MKTNPYLTVAVIMFYFNLSRLVVGLEAATDNDFTAPNSSICQKVLLEDIVDCGSPAPYLS